MITLITTAASLYAAYRVAFVGPRKDMYAAYKAARRAK